MIQQWASIKLGEVVKYKKGIKPKILFKDSKPDTTPYLTADYFRNKKAKLFTTFDKGNRFVEANHVDVILIWDGSNAGDVFMGLSGALASTMIKFLPNEKIENKFLYFFLKTKFNLLNGRTTGSTIPHVSKDVLNNLFIPLLNKAEQNNVIFILSKIQSAIETQEKIIKTATELKKALMEKLFTEGLHNEPQKDAEIGKVPRSWEVKKLGECVTVITKGASPKWQGFNYCDNGVLFIRSQNIGWGCIIKNENAYLPEAFNKIQKRSILKEGDVLINLVGASIGRVAVAPKEFEGANVNQAIALARVKKENYLSSFIMYFLLTDAGQLIIKRQVKEIARGNISLEDVNNFYVPMPTICEQEEIINILDSIRKKHEIASAKQQMLKSLFNTMLHCLMTGQTRINNIKL